MLPFDELTDADPRRGAAHSLKLDLAAVEFVSALRENGLPSIVLKGPSVQRLLYSDGSQRPYLDVDVLVPRDRIGDATEVLARLGYEKRRTSSHAHSWTRDRDQAEIDLHWTLKGATASPEEVWRGLAESTEVITIGGTRVDVLSPAGVACHVAMHTFQHGFEDAEHLADLERALKSLDRPTWGASERLARSIGASERFAAGLRVLPDGKALANDLGLSREVSIQTSLMSARSELPHAGLLASMYGVDLRRKLVLLWRVLVPPRSEMLRWWPAAGRGGAWMAMAYVRRLGVILRLLPRTLLVWRRVARANSASDPDS